MELPIDEEIIDSVLNDAVMELPTDEEIIDSVLNDENDPEPDDSGVTPNVSSKEAFQAPRSREFEGIGDEKTEQNHDEGDAKRLKGGGRGGRRTPKGRSCSGFQYCTSSRKIKGSNPLCVGIPLNIHRLPDYAERQENERIRKGRTLEDFQVACAGYSVFVNKTRSPNKQAKLEELPFCLGLQVLAHKVLVSKRAPAHSWSTSVVDAHSKEDGHELPQRPIHKPTHSEGNGFLTRYARSASLVASGVTRNVRRVGKYMKESLDESFDDYRWRPK